MFGRRLLFVFVALIAGVWIFIQVSRIFFAYTSDAYVLSDYVVLSPTVAGQLAEVSVGDNAAVARGDHLFTIDKRPYAFAVAQAKASVSLAEAAVKGAEDALTEAKAEVTASKAALEDTRTTEERIATLFRSGTVTQQRLDDAARDLQTATASLASAQAAVVVAEDLVVQRRGTLSAMKAALGVAEYNLEQTEVVSPYDGFVAPFTVRAGTYLDVGDPVMAVVDDTAWRIVANLPEENLAYVRVGQPVWFMVSSRPWRIYGGRVASISRGISRTPAPTDALPYVAPTTDWIRLSRRFPVEIAIDEGTDIPLFMGADARVLIRHPRDGGTPAVGAADTPAGGKGTPPPAAGGAGG